MRPFRRARGRTRRPKRRVLAGGGACVLLCDCRVTGPWRRIAWALGVALSAGSAEAGPPLKRNLDAYIIFGMRSVGLKNISVTGGCNTGVNCARPTANSDCGVVNHENPFYDAGSQIAADVARFNRPGGIIYQLFANFPNGLGNVTITEPPVESPNPLPLLPDADGDGTPSCRPGCDADPGDLAAACGFPAPFPACDPTRPVTVNPGSDCSGAPDAAPGNGRCDLSAGTYGDLTVQNDGKLTLRGGTYTFCGFQFGRRTETVATIASVVNVRGDVGINAGSVFGPAPGTECGKIRVNVAGPGAFSFGREATISGFFCAPERWMRLGHGNNLSGRFYADTVSADGFNRAVCCQGGVGGVCVEEPVSTDPALRRHLDAYFLIAMRQASVKNLSLTTPCNIGVNCGSDRGRSECGILATAGVTMADYSQIVGDQTVFRQGGNSVWQSFRNNNSPLDNVELRGPAPNPQPFATPLIPGTCDARCTPSVDAIKAACRFPSPFPGCDFTKPVRVSQGEDCPPFDVTPGNKQCDLPPGTYGSFAVLNDAWANLEAGTYVFCRARLGRRAKLTAKPTTTVLIPAGGSFRTSNGAEVAEECGDLKLLVDGPTSSVVFGRQALVAAQVCAPASRIRLGHGNVLIGRFIGDVIAADRGNVGRCCGRCP